MTEKRDRNNKRSPEIDDNISYIEHLVMTLDSGQWKALSHIRNRPYPVSLYDKRKLIAEI